MSTMLELLAITTARRRKVDEVMKEYDRDVYRPALQALRLNCESDNHARGRWDFEKGVLHCYMRCVRCGFRRRADDE